MYFLLLLLHTVFFFASYWNGYTLLAGIFLFLGMLFVFYFSPVFSYLLKSDASYGSWFENLSLERFSVESSFLISLFLLYFSIYGIIMGTIPWNNLTVIGEYHYTVILGIYVFLMGIFFIFQGKVGLVWFRVLRIHTLFSFILGIIFLTAIFFGYQYSPLLFFIGSIFPLIVTIWFFHQEEIGKEYLEIELFLGFLVTLVAIIPAFSFFFLGITSPIILTAEITLLSLFFFEWFPSIRVFREYGDVARYVGLILSYGAIAVYSFLSLQDLFLPTLFLIGLFFFELSVHTRYENYISFSAGILTLFFLYTSLFHGMLILEVGLFSALMFLFFLPFVIIGITYFFEQQYTHDFIFLHYSAIAFSILGSLYYLISLGTFSLVPTSIITLLLSGLFFLSYMRLGDAEKIA